MLRIENGWKIRSWVMFRLLLGGYLVVHFAGLLPWATELFSSAGMGTAAHSPLFQFVPSPLWLVDTPAIATGLVGIGLVLAAVLAVGVRDRFAAVGVLWVLACLFAANPLIANPSLPHIGWILLAHALIPTAPSLLAVWRGEGRDWRLPPEIFAAGWVVMGVAYGYSAVTKMAAQSWVDGTAMWHVLSNPLARPTILREVLLEQPLLLRLATWSALGLELFTPLLALSRRLRPALWLALLFLQVGLLVLVDFADLTWGMLVLQAWTFDPAWLTHTGRPTPFRCPTFAPAPPSSSSPSSCSS